MKEKIKHVIGLMSGTSLDGVDLVYVEFYTDDKSYTFKIIESNTFKYSEEWENKLKDAFSKTVHELKGLDITYGKYLGNLINTFIEKHAIENVDFVASHGHTIFHKPDEGLTLQIGCGETISKTTGLKVIYDFRAQDVALGGQGAPLVPIGDKLLFSEFKYCLNLGGFANISFEENGERKAFDICPVNIVMNHFAQKMGSNYDDKGIFASEGIVNKQLLNELNELPFYNSIKPKSLGYEYIVDVILPLIEKHELADSDVLRTFISHIVFQISDKINSEGQILVTGGGVFNDFLILELKKKLSNTIVIPENQMIDFKEALIFAFLGVLRNDDKINCLKSVTGASKDHSSGKICETL